MFASQVAPAHERGAAIYSRAVLGIYDTLVVRISNSWIWRSPSKLMLETYNERMSADHLEIGPGTGWYLVHAQLPQNLQLTLLDLNPNSLQTTSSRLMRTQAVAAPQISTIVGNVLQAATLPQRRFSSIGANYLLHCLPAEQDQRHAAVANMAEKLADDGVLFGSTILGDQAGHNLAGRGLMNLYNRLNIFDNRTDDVTTLHKMLEELFLEVTEIRVNGTVATFVASYPRR